MTKTVECDTADAICKNNTPVKDKGLLKVTSGLISERFQNTLSLVNASCANNTSKAIPCEYVHAYLTASNPKLQHNPDTHVHCSFQSHPIPLQVSHQR